jgi:hypothetical protein
MNSFYTQACTHTHTHTHTYTSLTLKINLICKSAVRFGAMHDMFTCTCMLYNNNIVTMQACNSILHALPNNL